ncbi:hypothetical protein GGC64_002995 [Mycobacterium sp. OAS707]|uniref:hypothetical protein n=1 Tax=Mycobacterium sp. OAS707 TaxID=2663822 RepID=UPI00178B8471|nr:hypothetical protein [Mycobacterium sp. OAS707]MBE1548971.1 hypothetical protein [Mycobacterium sp. OAS707]
MPDDALTGFANHFQADNRLAGSPALHSVMDMVTRAGRESGLGVSNLIGSEYLSQLPGATTGVNLTNLWAKNAGMPWHELHGGPSPVQMAAEAVARAREALDIGRPGSLTHDLFGTGAGGVLGELHSGPSPIAEAAARAREAWQELQAGPKLTDLVPPTPIWEKFNTGPSPMAQMTAEVAARARETLGNGPGSLTHDMFGKSSVGSMLEGLQSQVPDLASSFVPSANSVLSGLSEVMSGFADKMLGDPQWGPGRFFSTEYLTGVTSWMGAAGHQSWMDGVWRSPEESIAKVLQSFSALADHGLAWGWQALMAALRARRAVLRGDVEAIVLFLRQWLGFKRTPPTLVDAASSVLLEEAAWLPIGLEADEKLCPRIRKLTIDEHRNFRFIGDTQLIGRRVDALDRTVSITDEPDATLTLVDVVPASPPLPNMDDISDPRLLWIIDRLDERERRILRMKAEEKRTWADAAVSCGLAPADGENLRRKLKRLGKAADVDAPVSAAAAVWG